MKNLLLHFALWTAILSLVPTKSLTQWVQTNGPFGGDVSCFAVSGTNLFAGTYGGGVFLSTNNGANWKDCSAGLTNTAVTGLAVSGANLVAGTYGNGMALSTSNGTNWIAANSGLTNEYINCLVAGGTNLFAGTYGGVFLSTNGGTSWIPANDGLTNDSVVALAVGPDGAGGITVLAGTWGGGVFRSTNNGSSWNAANVGLTDPTVMAVAVSGSNLVAGTNSGVFRSTNNGTTWSMSNTGLTNTVVTAFVVNGTDFVAGTYGGGVFLSTDYGSHWSAVNSGLSNRSVWVLAVSDTNELAGTDDGGVFLSANSSATWSRVGTGLPDLAVFALAVRGTSLFAGTSGGGVWRIPLVVVGSEEWRFIMDADSANHGQLTFEKYADGSNAVSGTWHHMYQGSTIEGVFSSTTANITDTSISTVVVGTATYGSYTSDFAENMSGSVRNGRSSGVYSITFSGYGWPSTLQGTYTATWTSGSGVISAREIADRRVPNAFVLFQNYPNSFNPTTTIRYEIPKASTIKLTVYDILGREVQTLVNETKQPGRYETVFNAANLASGVYMYRLQAGSYVETKKLLLLR